MINTINIKQLGFSWVTGLSQKITKMSTVIDNISSPKIRGENLIYQQINRIILIGSFFLN